MTNSLIEYNDNSVIAQLGVPDMRIPIQYAITYPNKIDYKLDDELNINKLSGLSFKEIEKILDVESQEEIKTSLNLIFKFIFSIVIVPIFE